MAAQTKAPNESVNGNISDQQRLKADQDQDNWLLYGRTYENQRFSPVKEITADNVQNLQPVAILQTGVVGSFENSPLVYDGIMFVSTPYDHVLAYKTCGATVRENASRGSPIFVVHSTLPSLASRRDLGRRVPDTEFRRCIRRR